MAMARRGSREWLNGDPCQVSEWWNDTSPALTGQGRGRTAAVPLPTGGLKPSIRPNSSACFRWACVLRNSIWFPHRWLPGVIHMHPFSTVASSIATQADTGVMGRMMGQSGASWCQLVTPPWPGGLYWIWSCHTISSSAPVSWLMASTMKG